MTIIELFPWLLAICIAFLTGTLLARGGQSSMSVCVMAVIAGAASFPVYQLALKSLHSWAECRRTRKEKWEWEHRQYHDLDSAKPVGSELFFECSVCGHVVPSTPKKGVGCKCHNIVVDGESRRLEIRDRTKVRLFSYVPA
jgi:hypothetical protein